MPVSNPVAPKARHSLAQPDGLGRRFNKSFGLKGRNDQPRFAERLPDLSIARYELIG